MFPYRKSPARRSRLVSGRPAEAARSCPSSRWAAAVTAQPLAISTRFSKRNGRLIAIVDAGPLYAAVDENDEEHERCRDVLRRDDLELVVPALVVAEVSYLVGRRLGPPTEAAFLGSLAAVEVEAPSIEDWPTIAGLVERYGDFPLGGTDASVAALAERLGTDVIVTLDRRHFAAIRMSSGKSFRLLPE